MTNEADTWKTTREQNGIYENETNFLEECLNELSRHHVVGKSASFSQMAEQFFSGNKSLFKGSNVYDRGNADYSFVDEKTRGKGKWLKFPIVRVDFGSINDFDTFAQFENEYTEKIKAISRSHNLEEDWISFLIKGLHNKYKLPIIGLIENYDVPLDAAHRTGRKELARRVGQFLNNLFDGSLRNTEELEVLFITFASDLRDIAVGRKCGWDLEDFVSNVERITKNKFPNDLPSTLDYN